MELDAPIQQQVSSTSVGNSVDVLFSMAPQSCVNQSSDCTRDLSMSTLSDRYSKSSVHSPIMLDGVLPPQIGCGSVHCKCISQPELPEHKLNCHVSSHMPNSLCSSVTPRSRPMLGLRGLKRPSSLPIPSQVRRSRDSSGGHANFTQMPHLLTAALRGTPDDCVPNGRVDRITQDASNLMSAMGRNTESGASPKLTNVDIETTMNSSLNTTLPMRATWEPVPLSELGLRAPVWAADNAFNTCMLCTSPFTVIRRRHHCRACGRVLCAPCCSRRIRLPFTTRPRVGYNSIRSTSQLLFPNRPARVCSKCYEVLQRSSSKPNRSLKLVLAPSSKRQRSVAIPTLLKNTSSLMARPVPTQRPQHSFTVSDVNVELALTSRCEPLLFTFGQNSRKCSNFGAQKSPECWPPLVISTHTELILQYDPPASLLTSLLSSCEPSRTSPPVEVARDSLNIDFTKPLTQIANESLDWIPPGITWAITRNVHLHVHTTELSCCVSRASWCFSSRGFETLGQDEVVLLVRRRPNERLPPLSIYQYYQYLYKAITAYPDQKPISDLVNLDPCPCRLGESCRLSFYPLDHFFPYKTQLPLPTSNLDVSCSAVLRDDWLGCVFFRPTHQCLRGLHLPLTPFLIGMLVQQTERFWAEHIPLRLLLRLGKLARQYPIPLVSDRDRMPVFNCSSATSVFHLLGTSVGQPNGTHESTPYVCHLVNANIRLCQDDSTTAAGASHVILNILLPIAAQSGLCKFLDSLPGNCDTFMLTGGFDSVADSHLVCVQTDAGLKSAPTTPKQESDRIVPTTPSFIMDYYTEAISMASVDRKITGATFVILSSGASQLRVRIVEDGLVVQLQPPDFAHLLGELKRCRDVSLGPSAVDVSSMSKNNRGSLLSPDSVTSRVVFQWMASKLNASSGLLDLQRTSWIDGKPLPTAGTTTYLVPLHYQLAHWFRRRHMSYLTCPRLAWCKVHVIYPASLELVDTRFNTPLVWGPLINEAADALIKALGQHVRELRMSNHTRIALRIRLQPPDQMGYQVASLTQHDTTLSSTSNTEQSVVPLKDVSDQLAAQLDATLLPVMQTWARQVHCPFTSVESTVVATLMWELEFVLLD